MHILADAGMTVTATSAMAEIIVLMRPPRALPPPIVRQIVRGHNAVPVAIWRKHGKKPRVSGSIHFANRTMPDKLQEQVAAIWARALGVKKVGPDDNFCALGGHSLLGV